MRNLACPVEMGLMARGMRSRNAEPAHDTAALRAELALLKAAQPVEPSRG